MGPNIPKIYQISQIVVANDYVMNAIENKWEKHSSGDEYESIIMIR